MTRGEARPHALEQGRDPKDNHLQGNEAPQLPVGEPEFGAHNHHVNDHHQHHQGMLGTRHDPPPQPRILVGNQFHVPRLHPLAILKWGKEGVQETE